MGLMGEKFTVAKEKGSDLIGTPGAQVKTDFYYA